MISPSKYWGDNNFPISTVELNTKVAKEAKGSIQRLLAFCPRSQAELGTEGNPQPSPLPAHVVLVHCRRQSLLHPDLHRIGCQGICGIDCGLLFGGEPA